MKQCASLLGVGIQLIAGITMVPMTTVEFIGIELHVEHSTLSFALLIFVTGVALLILSTQLNQVRNWAQGLEKGGLCFWVSVVAIAVILFIVGEPGL